MIYTRDRFSSTISSKKSLGGVVRYKEVVGGRLICAAEVGGEGTHDLVSGRRPLILCWEIRQYIKILFGLSRIAYLVSCIHTPGKLDRSINSTI
jgi:hypothetical protein